MFPGPTGGHAGHSLRSAFPRWVEAIGREYGRGTDMITWHSLKHTAGTLLAPAGASAIEIQSALAHKDPATSRRYVHAANQHQAKAVERLGGVLAFPGETASEEAAQ